MTKGIIGLLAMVSALTLVEQASAGDIVVGGTITSASTYNLTGTTYFLSMTIAGGTGVCTSIKFPKAGVSVEAQQRAVSFALAALLSGKAVRIHNYADNTCENAQYISISS